jgi:hypothetical protein
MNFAQRFTFLFAAPTFESEDLEGLRISQIIAAIGRLGDRGRGSNPAAVFASKGTAASAKSAGLQLNHSPPGSFVNRNVRIIMCTLPTCCWVD